MAGVVRAIRLADTVVFGTVLLVLQQLQFWDQ